MSIEIKSLEKYVEQCISELTYFDFSPPIDHTVLAARFAEIFHKENGYWERPELKDSWPRWVFLIFKSFRAGQLSPIFGMSFNKNKITLTLTTDLSLSQLENEKNRVELNIYDIWLNHAKLYEELINLIKTGIGQANLIK
jgi:hypothetical protein